MELQSDTANVATDGAAQKAVTGKPAKKVKQNDAKRDESKQRVKRKVRPSELNAPQYQIRTTVVRKKVKVGDQGLARMLERQWLGIHHSLYYVTVFAPTAIGGRIVNAANVGIREYIQERLEAAERMLTEAQSQAADAAIEMGAPGQTSDHVVEISSQIETDVLAMVRAYDDYLVVMDSLWIGREILDDKRDAAHRIVREDIGSMGRLLSKLRSKLITYRREKGAGSMTKTEELVVLEVEDIIIESLSKQAQDIRLKERERTAAKAQKKEEAKLKAAPQPDGEKKAPAEKKAGGAKAAAKTEAGIESVAEVTAAA